jgi:hypothetical protein
VNKEYGCWHADTRRIDITNDAPPARALEAQLHEMSHDGFFVATGDPEPIPHDVIRMVSRTIVVSLTTSPHRALLYEQLHQLLDKLETQETKEGRSC